MENVGTPELLIVSKCPSVEDEAVINADVPWPNKTPLVVCVAARTLATPKVPLVIAEAANAIEVEFALRTRPFAELPENLRVYRLHLHE